MPTDPQLEEFLAALSAEAGTPPLRSAECEEALRLVRVAAGSMERRYAPLAAYAAGLALGQLPEGATEQARIEWMRRLADTVRELRRVGRA